MKRFSLLFLPVAAAIVLSCGQRKESGESISDYETAAPEVKSEAPAVPAANASPGSKDLYAGLNRNIIKKAHYRFSVADVHKTAEVIETAILKWPAYIETSSLTLDDQVLQSKMTIRIENEYFAECLKAVDKQALSIDFRNISTDDVSKEFVDLESRLRTKREVEARYTEILRKKAGTIEEVLQAEQQIGALHEEIEATIRRLNYLKDQVGYSTIELEFYQPVTMQAPVKEEAETFRQRFIIALNTGWTALTTIVLAVTYLWPLLLAGGITLVFLKLRKRKFART